MSAGAATLGLLAAVCFAVAATLWQKAALDEGIEVGKPTGFLRLLTNWIWLLGLGAQILGIALQAAALDRGRVAIIQPLLVTAIVWALPLGYVVLGQAVGARHVLGAALVVAGLAVFASVGDPAGGVDNAPASRWFAAYLVIAALCAGLLLFVGRGGADAKTATYGVIAGCLYAVSAVLMKPLLTEFHSHGLGAVLEGWQVWVWAITAVVGFYLQQISLSFGRLATSVATVSVANPIVSVLLGAAVLQERLDWNPPRDGVIAVGALAIGLLGAVVIASASAERESERPSGVAPDLAMS
jgi:drug/metabolite transporter (DMT)-like permease